MPPTVISQRSRAMTQSSNASSRNYPADTAQQRFMEDIYNKETMKRLTWYFANRQAAGNGSELPGSASRQKEMCRKRIEAACPRPTSSLMRLRERYQPVADYRKRAFRMDALPALDDASSGGAAPTRPPPGDLESDMRPVDQTTKSKLYAGLSHEGKGRVDYLRTRSLTLPPEERYRLPITSSFEYGWRLSDVMDEPAKPGHARAKLVKDTFYSRNGINPLSLPLGS